MNRMRQPSRARQKQNAAARRTGGRPDIGSTAAVVYRTVVIRDGEFVVPPPRSRRSAG
jgi:hypothetical protein